MVQYFYNLKKLGVGKVFKDAIEKTTNKYLYSARRISGDGEYNPDGYAIIHITDGEALYATEKNEYRLSAGDMLFIPKEEPLIKNHENSSAYSRQLIQFNRSSFDDIFHDIPDFFINNAIFIPQHSAVRHGMTYIFSNIHEYAAAKRDESDFMILTYIAQLMTKIKEFQNHNGEHGELRAKKNIIKITDYIDENITSPINLDSIAQYLYMDKSYICRLFKSGTGITINTYINTKKIELAKNMLSEGSSPRAVCVSCGFNDYSTFYRAFKRHTGAAPEEFRRFRAT